MFLSPNNLPTKSLDFIRRELEDIISRSSAQKDNVKLKSFGLFTVAKKSEVQDLLDSILKTAYPYISQARKLTDMNKELEYSLDSGTSLNFSLLPELLPEGYDDKSSVIVGNQNDKNGTKSVVKIHVWRAGKFVWYEHKDAMFYKIISSESEPVNMEDAESGHVAYTISATGKAKEKWKGCLGNFTLVEKEHRGRPVYMQSGLYLHSLESGAWGVSANVENSQPLYRSTTASSSPALCHQWQYSDAWGGGTPFKFNLNGDITVTVKKM